MPSAFGELSSVYSLATPALSEERKKTLGGEHWTGDRLFPQPLSHVALGGAPAPPPYRRAVCRSPFGEISRLGPRPREACNLRVSASRPRDPAPNPSGAERPGDARCQLPLEGRPAGPRNFSPETGPGNRSEVGSGGAEPGGSR